MNKSEENKGSIKDAGHSSWMCVCVGGATFMISRHISFIDEHIFSFLNRCRRHLNENWNRHHFRNYLEYAPLVYCSSLQIDRKGKCTPKTPTESVAINMKIVSKKHGNWRKGLREVWTGNTLPRWVLKREPGKRCESVRGDLRWSGFMKSGIKRWVKWMCCQGSRRGLFCCLCLCVIEWWVCKTYLIPQLVVHMDTLPLSLCVTPTHTRRLAPTVSVCETVRLDRFCSWTFA